MNSPLLPQKKSYLDEHFISPVHRHWEGATSLGDWLSESKYFLSRVLYTVSKWPLGFFEFDGERHSYFNHRYSMTWRSERAVEVPIIREKLRRKGSDNALEIGNVFNHYFPFPHTVVDKYERGKDVLNVDAEEHVPRTPYDLIFTISTLEHMGFDEPQKDPDKPKRVVEHLVKKCLNPGGLFIATFPFGYNPHLDSAVQKKAPPFSNVTFLKKISVRNHWRQADLSEVLDSRYGVPFPFANALSVLEIHKS